ncbi:MAG: nuclear transport factor 2 family protein [Ilumatobacteraceae bacterium]
MTNANEALDRALIAEQLARYSWALADRDWNAWAAVFTSDAHVDFSTAGGPVGSPDDAAKSLAAMMAGFDVSLSSGGNVTIDFIDTDSARVRSIYTMTMRIPGADGGAPTYMQASGWYIDEFRRTPAGWRLHDRFEQLAYVKPA